MHAAINLHHPSWSRDDIQSGGIAQATAVTRVLVVEDDDRLRELLYYHLTHEGYVVEESRDGQHGLDRARQIPFDLVLLDITLPDMPGISWCQLLRDESRVPIVLMTERADEADGISALDLGADDYVVKPLRFTTLLARMRAVLRRTRPSTAAPEPPLPARLAAEDLRVYVDTRRVFRGAHEIQLSPKEFDILVVLMQNRGRIVARELLFKTVWGHDDHEGIRTVDVHIRWLRGKIEDDSAHPHFIQTVRGLGYRFVDMREELQQSSVPFSPSIGAS